MDQPASLDGRSARRERNRLAVIEAVFSLVDEGKIPPPVESIAERAGVSVSSIFRNFDGLADIQNQAHVHADRRWAAHFVVSDADASQADRIASHVRTRVAMFEADGALMRLARSRALDHEQMVKNLARLRGKFADQTRQRFASEIRQLTPAAAADLVAIVDTVTSPEAYDLMAAAHARSSRQITRAWVSTLTSLLAEVGTATEQTKGNA